MCFWYLDVLRPYIPERKDPSEGDLIPRGHKQLAWEHVFHMQTNHARAQTPRTSFKELIPSRLLSSLKVTTTQGQGLGMAPMSQSRKKLHTSQS